MIDVTGHLRYTVRPVCDQDLPDLLALYHRCEDFISLGPVATASIEMVQKDLEISRESGGCFCGLFDEQGCLFGVWDTISSGFEGRPDTAFIELLMIDPEHRNQGFGEVVVYSFEQEMLQKSAILEIRSGVQSNNPSAIRFWLRMGFDIIGEAEWLPDQTIAFPLRKWLTRSPMEISLEQPEDVADIRKVNEIAFGRRGEANLVDALRSKGAITYSLVAKEAGQVIGHILFSPVRVLPGNENLRAQGIGPLAVLPEYQKKGVGAALMRAGLEACREAGEELVVLVGNPKYYHRFGFDSASKMGLKCEYDVPDPVFMALKVEPGVEVIPNSIVYYDPEFQKV